jgi:hypothetical protein
MSQVVGRLWRVLCGLGRRAWFFCVDDGRRVGGVREVVDGLVMGLEGWVGGEVRGGDWCS